MLEQLKMMISKIRELPLKIEKAEEELHRMRDKKEETRKRWACSPTSGGTSRNSSTVTMIMLAIMLAMTCSLAANDPLKVISQDRDCCCF
jgi:hypothetical protein